MVRLGSMSQSFRALLFLFAQCSLVPEVAALTLVKQSPQLDLVLKEEEAEGNLNIAVFPDELLNAPILPETFKVTVDDIAIGMISGRKEFNNAIYDSVLQNVPNHALFTHDMGYKKCACNFRKGFRELKQMYPDSKWYYVGDEDAIINLKNLEMLLSAYNSSMPVVVSRNRNFANNICVACGGECPASGAPKTGFYGGQGQILSAGFIKLAEYSKRLSSPCGKKNGNQFGTSAADVENTCHLLWSWDSLSKSVPLGGVDIPRKKVETVNYIKEFGEDDLSIGKWIVSHHMLPSEIQDLAGINADVGKQKHDLKIVDFKRECN